MKEYNTIANDIVCVDTVIDKSTFIGYAMGVQDIAHAQQFVADITKKHYDATHNCYAYIVGDKAKYSDDGEPQGTAGLPILECIKANNLDKVVVVVTRYFGGKLLGAGGLVRAYSGSCASALHSSKVLHYRQCHHISIDIDYTHLTIVKRTMENSGILCDTVYDSNVVLHYLILVQDYESISKRIVDITNGKAIVNITDTLLQPYGEKL